MPTLSIRRRPELLRRRRTQRFSFSSQNLRYCRFGRKRRLVLLLAWETLFPTIGRLPVTWHTRAMKLSFGGGRNALCVSGLEIAHLRQEGGTTPRKPEILHQGDPAN